MQEKQLDLIRKVLSNECADDHVLLEFERLGELAFDEIVRQYRAGLLTPEQRRLILRRLALLSRHACADRKEEVLDLGLELLESPDRTIRSAAVTTTIWAVVLLESTPSLVSRAENRPGATPSLRARVKAAVRHALELGINESEVEFAHEFLVSPPKPRWNDALN
jgi:hypothetical protein